MTEQERVFFEELYKDRLESSVIFSKPSVRGVWMSIVDKYSDQAHFIYELLQNADDAGAKSIRFELYKDRLVFLHNGTRRFTVSNPQSEERDGRNGRLGDINSITAIANSNKTDESQIGKFGVGFKAVFQYTMTPVIYDPNVAFRLENYIVPVLEMNDYPGRQQDQTVFVFPFNHPKKTAGEAYENISTKLQSLVFPQLFLQHIEEITFAMGDRQGEYIKQVRSVRTIGGTKIEDIRLLYRDRGAQKVRDERMWLCSRTDKDGNSYSVGFFYNDKGNIVPKELPAFCFFPTKQNTGLRFIIHAPFLLTDSREGIQAGKQHNREMVKKLAELAACGLVLLRDIGLSHGRQIIGRNIFSVVPIREDDFAELDDRDTLSFRPFYSSILEVLRNEKILPAVEGYVEADNAFWANTAQTSEIFTDKQLQQVEDDEEARWIDIGSGYQNCKASNYVLYRFLTDELNVTEKEEDELLENVNADFIANQTKEWLLSFYKYIVANRERVDEIRHKPIFIDNTGVPSAAFKEDHGDQAILFLPSEGITGFKTIHPDYAAHRETINLAKALEIRVPSLKEEIYNVILPLYELDEIPDDGPNFVKFYQYFQTCSRQEADDFIRLIADKYIIACHTLFSDEHYMVIPREAYIPSEKDKSYLELLDDVWIVDMDYYQDLGIRDSERFREFLRVLGVKEKPGLIKLNLKEGEEYNGETINEYNMLKYAAKGTKWGYNTGNYYSSWILPVIPGIEEALNNIGESGNYESSEYIWNLLLSIAKDGAVSYYGYDEIYSYLLKGTFNYYYRTNRSQSFETHLPALFRETEWLVDQNGDFVAPEDTALEDLADFYNLSDQYSDDLVRFLRLKVDEDAPEDSLSQKQREMIDVGRMFTEAGYTLQEIPDLLARLKTMKEQEERVEKEENKQLKKTQTRQPGILYTESQSDREFDIFPGNLSAPKKKVLHDIWKMAEESETAQGGNDTQGSVKTPFSSIEELDKFLDDDTEPDEDDFIKPTVDYEKKIRKEKKKSAEAIDLITLTQEYDTIAAENPQYSYAWFKALLNLEIINSRQNTGYRQNISISFGKVRRESENNRTLILEQPDRYIPQNIEDVADVAMILRGEDFEKLVAIEVANIRSYTLRVKLKNLDQIADINLDEVRQATISIQNPVFLLDELQKAFEKLALEDKDNLQRMLCSNIRFIFGPPGTGKTTYLAEKVIGPLMNDRKDFRVLVLTPTNKAADVLTARVMGSISATDYQKWLIRFGITADETVERSGVYKEKTTDIRQYRRCTVITTIARFPYDFFMPGDNIRLFLSEMDWDYIIIDEASMIPLINIIYPLYKQKPIQFIIAGDPFQIEPIVSIKQWKNENIYTMTGLNSFEKNAVTYPHAYPVEKLMTQYRSVPSVGTIFSEFAYGGVLRHNRHETDRKELNLGTELSVSPLNIIKFPTSKYESIYRSKKLNQSNYQIYSALFTFEFCHFLADRIHHNYPGKNYTIGIVAPYRAEADLIEKLKNTIKVPKEIRIQAGTIHGFQGDECDIVIVVLNTPPKISGSPEMFLNKKNIINVAVSRAKDYLFVIMPDDDTEGINNLRLVKKVEALCRRQSDYCSCFTTEELERVMFNQPDYLELNSFSTGHQAVNVYGLPEMKYEIRSEDTAVDVQIHENQDNRQAEIQWSDSEGKTQNNDNIFFSGDAVFSPVSEEKTANTIDAVEKTNTESREPIVCYRLSSKHIMQCPFDQALLRRQNIQVWRKGKDKPRFLNMRVCSQCGRNYLSKNEIQSIKLDYFHIVLKETEQSGSKIKKENGTERYIFRYSTNQTNSNCCRWPGCKDQAFKDGLCWEHFQHEMGEI